MFPYMLQKTSASSNLYLRLLSMRTILGVVPLTIAFNIVAFSQDSPPGSTPAAKVPSPPPSLDEARIKSPNQLDIKETAPGVLELGVITLNQKNRSVSFPASINMHEGPIEYFLVAPYGKVHESVLQTNVSPINLHVCAVLLKSPGANFEVLKERFEKLEPGQVVPDQELNQMLADGLFGQKIGISVSWEDDKGQHHHPAEKLLFNTRDKKAMEPEKWYYTGSRVHDGIYEAARNGDMITVIGDYGSMINYIGHDFKNDEMWTANVSLLPPVNHPVKVTFHFPGGSSPEVSSGN